MTRFKLSSPIAIAGFAAFLGLSAVAGSGMNNVALAQQNNATVVGVVDVASVERQSIVWKDLTSKIDAQRAEMTSILQGPQQELRERQRELADQRLLLSEDAFRAEQEKFAKDGQAFQARGLNLKRQVEKNLAGARQQIRKRLTQILANISQERGMELVLNSSAPNSTVLFFASTLSLSEEALKRLDADMTTVNVPPLVKE